MEACYGSISLTAAAALPERRQNPHGTPMQISLVIPALNEAGNIGRLVEESYRVIPPGLLGEVIVVDDGSSDATAAEVVALAARYQSLRCLSHDRRSGQSTALRTGITAARFPVIATMDGDGQNDPADIARLVARLAAPGAPGPALVNGWRQARKAAGSRRFASRFANALRDLVLADDCPDTGCGIKAYHRDAFLRLPFFTSMHRYLPAFFRTYGLEVVNEPVNDRPRLEGKSKYSNLGRALIGVHDLFGVAWLRRRTRVPAVTERRP